MWSYSIKGSESVIVLDKLMQAGLWFKQHEVSKYRSKIECYRK